MKKPRLLHLTECFNEIREAAHQVNLSASSLYGVIEQHCEMLDIVMPGRGAALRKVAAKYYDQLQAAQQRLREL